VRTGLWPLSHSRRLVGVLNRTVNGAARFDLQTLTSADAASAAAVSVCAVCSYGPQPRPLLAENGDRALKGDHDGDEYLLIMVPGTAISSELSEKVQVRHLVSDRMAVVNLRAEAPERITCFPEVSGLYTDTVPPDVLADLTDTEALFARAWMLRRTSTGKHRPYEGLDWDAPGMEPP
jgi:hypothetical protein